MLDPQLQGVAWVKERLAKQGLVCLRMGAPDMLRAMERAISEVSPSLALEATVGAGLSACSTCRRAGDSWA